MINLINEFKSNLLLQAKYAIAKGLAGGMIWSFDTDDFRNRCGKGAYPILTQIKNTLADSSPLQLPPAPATSPPQTTAPTN